MKTIFILILLTISTLTQAQIITRVLHINSPETISENYEVLIAKNKSVLEVAPNQAMLIKEIFKAAELNSVVEIIEQNKEIISFKVIEEGDNILDFYQSEEIHPMTNYTPTEVTSLELAQEMFKTLKKRTKWFTQCFNRAHIWSKQLFDKYNTKSMKILIYYTKRYRKEINGKWWFHIAPMINVQGQHYVLDKEFTNSPVTDSNWEKIFTKKMEQKGIYGYRCKVIKNIKEYYDEYNQQNEYCNIQVTSMYYWEPNDMSKLDKKGTQKTSFLNSELRIAAREVFWKWRKVYKEIKNK